VTQPTPSFAAACQRADHLQGDARTRANAVNNAKIYVSEYETRVTPVGTSNSSGLTGAVKFVPGTYDFVAEAPGYGDFRFTRTFTAGQTSTVTVAMPTNWASSGKGATVASSTGTSTTQGNLIDEPRTRRDDAATVGAQSVTVAGGRAQDRRCR
jgi:hypothetical protein